MADLSYRQLAKEKENNLRLADLTAAREKVLAELEALGINLATSQMTGGPLDEAAIQQEINQVQAEQAKLTQASLHQQLTDYLQQASEGSVYVALKKRWQTEPKNFLTYNLAALQNEQLHYQDKQLAIFDFLQKHFEQFEQMVNKEMLSMAGKRFLTQVVGEITQELQDLMTQVKTWQASAQKNNKNLLKMETQAKRWQEKLTAELQTGQLESDDKYARLLSEIGLAKQLQTTNLNRINALIDEKITTLETIVAKLNSVVEQNQVTRQILKQLRLERDCPDETWRELVTTRLQDFDEQIAQALLKTREIEEILDFQEYLAQIFGDSLQVLTSNLEDLYRERAEYGQVVLEFFS